MPRNFRSGNDILEERKTKRIMSGKDILKSRGARFKEAPPNPFSGELDLNRLKSSVENNAIKYTKKEPTIPEKNAKPIDYEKQDRIKEYAKNPYVVDFLRNNPGYNITDMGVENKNSFKSFGQLENEYKHKKEVEKRPDMFANLKNNPANMENYNPNFKQKVKDTLSKVNEKVSTFAYGLGGAFGGKTVNRLTDDIIFKELEKEYQETGNPDKLKYFILDRQYWDEDKLLNSFRNMPVNAEITGTDRLIKQAGETTGDIGQLLIMGQLVGGIKVGKAGLSKLIQRGTLGTVIGAEGAYGAGADAQTILKESMKSAGFFIAGGAAADKVGSTLINKLTPIYEKYPQFAKALQVVVNTSKGGAMGIAGAGTSAGLNKMFGEDIKPSEIIKTGLTLAAYEFIVSALSKQPFVPSYKLNGNQSLKISKSDTKNYFKKNGYVEFKKNSGIWLKRDPKTGAILEQKMEIVTVKGANVYRNDIWKVEKELGRKLKPSEIVQAAKNPRYWKVLRYGNEGVKAAESVNKTMTPGTSQAKSGELMLTGSTVKPASIITPEIKNQKVVSTNTVKNNEIVNQEPIKQLQLEAPKVVNDTRDIEISNQNQVLQPKEIETSSKLEIGDKINTSTLGEVEVVKTNTSTITIKNEFDTKIEVEKPALEKQIIEKTNKNIEKTNKNIKKDTKIQEKDTKIQEKKPINERIEEATSLNELLKIEREFRKNIVDEDTKKEYTEVTKLLKIKEKELINGVKETNTSEGAAHEVTQEAKKEPEKEIKEYNLSEPEEIATDTEGVDIKGGVEGLSSTKFGPKLGNASGTTKNNYQDVKSASKIQKEFIRRFDIAVKKGGIKNRALGTFNNQTHIIRIVKANDLGVLSHETGHFLDKTFNLSASYGRSNRSTSNNKIENIELLKLGEKTSRPSYPNWRKRREGVAEYLRTRLTLGEEAARNIAPNFHIYFDNTVNPDFVKVTNDLAKHIDKLTNLDAVSRIKTSIRFKETTKESTYNKLDSMKDIDLNSFFRKVYAGIVDATYPIEWAANELAGKRFKTLIANELSRFRGYEGIALYDINPGGNKDFKQTNLTGNDVGKTYYEITKSFHTSEEKRRDFWAYSVARRNKDYVEKGLEMPDTPETYERAVKMLEISYPEFNNIFKELSKYRDNSLNLLVEAGIYGTEQIEEIRDANPNYVPLKRIKEAFDGIEGSSKKMGGSKKVVKKRTGGGEDIQDPEEYDIINTFINRSVALRNKMLVELADAADNVEGMGHIMTKAPKKLKMEQFNLEQVKKYLTEVFSDRADIQKHFLDAKQFVDTLNLDILARIFKPNYMAGPNQVVVYRKGEAEIYDVNPELYEAINGIGYQEASILTKTLMSVAQIQKVGIISTPKFVAYNLGRDTFHNLVSTNNNLNPVDIMKGLVSSLKKDKWYRFAQRNGGTTNYFTANDRKFAQEAIDDIMHNQNKAVKIINKVLHPLKTFQDSIEPGEMAGRTAEMRKALTNYLKEFGFGDKQINEIDDMYLSNLSGQIANEVIAGGRNLSIDFRKSGGWIKKFNYNRIVNFLNPQIQGTVNTAKLFNKKNIFKTTIRGLAYLTIPTILLYNLNKNNKYYQELPHWRKDFFWNIPIGNSKDAKYFIPLPRPWELGLIFAALPERLLEAQRVGNKEAYDEFLDSIEQAVMPEFMPSALEPLYRDATGRDWKGDTILSFSDKRVEPDMQYNDYTPDILVNISKGIKNVPGLPKFMYSPKRLQKVVEGYTGTLGRIALGGSNSFIVDAQRTPQSITSFYDYKDKLETMYATAKRKDEKVPMNVIGNRKAFNKAADMLELLRKAEYEIEQSDRVDKKKQITAIRSDMIEIARAMNKLYRSTYRQDMVK